MYGARKQQQDGQPAPKKGQPAAASKSQELVSVSVKRHEMLPAWCGEGGTAWPKEATHYIMSSCGMATGGECTCDPDECACTLCQKHGRYPPGSRAARAAKAKAKASKAKAGKPASKGAHANGSCCGGGGGGGGAGGKKKGADDGEESKGPRRAEYEQRDPGCAMAWEGKCTCEPETCQCFDCVEHRRRGGKPLPEAKEEEAKVE